MSSKNGHLGVHCQTPGRMICEPSLVTADDDRSSPTIIDEVAKSNNSDGFVKSSRCGINKPEE